MPLWSLCPEGAGSGSLRTSFSLILARGLLGSTFRFQTGRGAEDPETFYALLAASLRGGALIVSLEMTPRAVLSNAYPGPCGGFWKTNTEQIRAMHLGREGTVYLMEEFLLWREWRATRLHGGWLLGGNSPSRTTSGSSTWRKLPRRSAGWLARKILSTWIGRSIHQTQLARTGQLMWGR